MNLSLSRLLKLSFALCLLGLVQSTFAASPHGKGGGHARYDMKPRQIVNRNVLRQTKQSQLKESESVAIQAAPIPTQTPLSSAVQQNQGTIERERNGGFNRLTPEERQALRRQIKEANREIYLQRTQ